YRARSHHPPRFTAALASPRSACAAETPRRKAQARRAEDARARPDWAAGLSCHASLSRDVWGCRAHAGGVATRRGFLLGRLLLEGASRTSSEGSVLQRELGRPARQPSVQAQRSDPLFFPDSRSTEERSESRARVLVRFWPAGLKFLGLRRGLGSPWRFGGCSRRLRTPLPLCLAQAHLVLFFLGAAWILAFRKKPVLTVSSFGSLDPLCGHLAYLQVSEWLGTHLEPADTENSCHPGWPWGPECDLAADTAPGATAPQVQILEMPSKTSVCTLKPEADAKPGMPMCLRLWQANPGPRPLLLVGYEDGSVALWDISERKVCSRIACHGEPVMGLDFDSQKTRGISGSAGKALAVWSLDGQQALQVCHTHELTNPGIADVMIRPDRKILATAGWDHRIRIFHWRTMKPLAVLAFHSASVHCVAFAADGLLAAGSKDQRISIWSLYQRT
uniref:Guanine nucleotide-binding protein subunit beta-like protein 1 n=1 Tax=Urocitellus parryii TaxID=9999 RepID=A0A8D2HNW3_UROPR